MTKLLLVTVFIAIGCNGSQSKIDTPAHEGVAPTPDAKGAQPGLSRNLALEHVLGEEPKADCVVYYHHAGQFSHDSVKCTLPNKVRVYVSVDTLNGPKVSRTSPLTDEEIAELRRQQAQPQTVPPSTPVDVPVQPAPLATK